MLTWQRHAGKPEPEALTIGVHLSMLMQLAVLMLHTLQCCITRPCVSPNAPSHMLMQGANTRTWQAVVGGDDCCCAIAAASIIAKVLPSSPIYLQSLVVCAMEGTHSSNWPVNANADSCHASCCSSVLHSPIKQAAHCGSKEQCISDSKKAASFLLANDP